ncbi:probable polygalacturonase At3g15720 [Vicia villosa]|uniref:probable polygalacturonase At3g15720 n=1 Tax=Vicia villosa TaxID=3911 RepID=UPI00273ADDA7|nr:probable polygalacturonase At3g15720 [Vicia villosa]
MKDLFPLFLVFVIASHWLCFRLVGAIDFNVVNYGAKGDGLTDDSIAFLKAWQAVCVTTRGTPTLIIPQHKTFMLQPLSFQGPCKSTTINVMIMGTITAPKNPKNWKWVNNDDDESWVKFDGIDGLVINGGGKIDGKGAPWYRQSNRPTALRFLKCDNLKLIGPLTHINSPKNHISITSCNGALLSRLHIISPENSPDTDGIDISTSTNIHVEKSTISTSDDCIAINSGSKLINIVGIKCGFGHGISVGSLGKDGKYATVEEVHVRNVTFKGTTNGARIKTWAGGSGYARNITYEDIILIGVKNPIIIDQHYDAYNILNNARKVDRGSKAVKVSDVIFRNNHGTTISKDAIKLDCDVIGCTNILLEDINITSLDGEIPHASCNNAQGSCISCNINVPCLK